MILQRTTEHHSTSSRISNYIPFSFHFPAPPLSSGIQFFTLHTYPLHAHFPHLHRLVILSELANHLNHPRITHAIHEPFIHSFDSLCSCLSSLSSKQLLPPRLYYLLLSFITTLSLLPPSLSLFLYVKLDSPLFSWLLM